MRATKQSMLCSPIHNTTASLAMQAQQAMSHARWVVRVESFGRLNRFVLAGRRVFSPLSWWEKASFLLLYSGAASRRHALSQRVCCLRRSGFCFCLCFMLPARDAATFFAPLLAVYKNISCRSKWKSISFQHLVSRFQEKRHPFDALHDLELSFSTQ